MAERVSDSHFRIMNAFINVVEFFAKTKQKRARTFGLKEGMTVVDYACGSGWYTLEYSKIVGTYGKVYAVDIHPLAVKAINQKSAKLGLCNVEAKLARGYDSTLEMGIADVVTALDVFFKIENPAAFLTELSRICKPDGVLIIDDGHQSRTETKEKLRQANVWVIMEESKTLLKCRQVRC